MNIKNSNQNSIVLANSLVHHSKNKHVGIHHHYIPNKVQKNRVIFNYVFSVKDQMPAWQRYDYER